MLENLRPFIDAHGVSGCEGAVRDFIRAQITPFADKVYTDTLGNLVAVKRGAGKKVMLMAHTDEIGLVCSYVDDDGFIRVAPVGGVNPANFLNSHVTFENGVRGVFSSNKKEPGTGDCFVDIGERDRAAVLSRVEIGMTARFDSDSFENGSVIVSRSLDDRLGCYILAELMKRRPETDAEVYYVFTVQEEVGLRGAKVSGFDISPDIAIAVDVTRAVDTPDDEDYGCKLHGGAAIKVRDRSAICSRVVIEGMERVAAQRDIPVQRDVLVSGGTDIGAVQTAGRAVQVGGVSIPVRRVHTCSETASKKDVAAVCDLLQAYLENGLEKQPAVLYN